MPEAFTQTLTQVAVVAAVVVVVFILIAIGASGTSIGRALLPRAVIDAVSKLLPRGVITDAAANALDEFEVKVNGTGESQTIHVRRYKGATIAWTYDAATKFPQAGSFAFTGLQYDPESVSVVVPEEVERRIGAALADVLPPKGFVPRDAEKADLWIKVFGALEDEATLETISQAFDEPGGHQWAGALRTALQHDRVGEVATFARGSLVLEVTDARSKKALWRAAVMADIVVDVSPKERERRTREAIAEILRRFPP